jgi:hypothetical protein
MSARHRSPTCRGVALFLIAAGAGGCAGMRAARQPDPALQPYLACRPSDPELRHFHTESWRREKNYREVTSGSETRRVSVIDGYRVLYVHAATETPFANVKVERSAPAEYAADKAFLIRMQHDMPQFDKVTYWSAPVNGLEVHGIDKTAIDVGGVVGVYLIFEDRKQVVTSVYLLNQGPKVRKFVELESYKLVRDRFLGDLTRCSSAT